MKKVTVVIEKGNPGSDNMAINLKGMELPKRDIHISLFFDERRIIGLAKPFFDNGILKADMEFFKEEYDHLYPSIGYQSIDCSCKSNKVSKSKLLTISLGSQNADRSIKSIGEQANDSD